MCPSFSRTLSFPSKFSWGFSCKWPIWPLCPPHFQWHHTDTQSHSTSHMLVYIKQSKKDPFRQGRTITIAKSSSPICLLMAMKDYLLQAQPPSSHPLFAFVQPRHWLTRNNLTTELRSILQHCGLPANNFYSHSFRIGAATTAAKAGLPPWLIKVLGRWSSDCYERYIRTPKCTILEVPRLLANTSP